MAGYILAPSKSPCEGKKTSLKTKHSIRAFCLNRAIYLFNGFSFTIYKKNKETGLIILNSLLLKTDK
jgi:hypothetical protein